MTEEVLALIFEYFKMDVLQKWPMSKDMQAEIIKTFTSVAEKKLNAWQIFHLLKGSNIESLRNKIAEYHKANYKPYPIKLGQLKPDLQEEAVKSGVSLHRYILNILWERKTMVS